MKKYLSCLLAAVMVCGLLAGCSKTGQTEQTQNPGVSENGNQNGASGGVEYNDITPEANVTDSTVPPDTSDMFTDRDSKTDYTEKDSIRIELTGSSAKTSDNSVKISGSTITITENKTHIISGTLDDGMLIVDAKDTAKLQLVFNGVNITSKTSAPFYIVEADKVFVTLAEGTTNSLINGGAFTAIDSNNIDGAVFSKQDLTFNGAGSLTVTSPAGHGIVCKDDLVFTGGDYTINAASHGIDANDSVRVSSATRLTVDAGKDGIHAENSDDTALGFVYISDGAVQIEAEGDGISAGSYLQIEGGSFDILAGGGSKNGNKQSSDHWGGFPGRPGYSSTTTTEDSTSMKGLKAGGDLVITGGSFQINSADDGIHANASVTVSGGVFTVATGDDGIHGEENLTVSAGDITITESYEGLEALHIKVTGGNIKLTATDDGLNAAGGTDGSGTSGGRDGMFGGGGRPGKNPMGGGGMSSSSKGSIVISGGNLYIKASGDGVDANGTLEITGGYTVVTGPTQGDTATLDYDVSGVITGGTFIGTGASGMAQSFSSSEQGVIAVRVNNQSAGTKITLTDQSGKVLVEHTPELSFAVVILSSPDLVSGETYRLRVGTNENDVKAN